MRNAFDFYEKIWLPSEEVISDIEAAGIRIDPSVCTEYLVPIQARIEELQWELNCWVSREVNWGSPKQVAEILYDYLALPVPPIKGTLRGVQMTDEGDRPTGEASIQYLADHSADPEVKDKLRKLLELKKAVKDAQFHVQLPTFADSRGRVHCQLGPNTETGRLTAKIPNLQQMPQTIRAAFIAAAGHSLVCLDYSGLEWRVLAHILAYKYMEYGLVNDILRGVNPHSDTALRMSLVPHEFPNATVKDRCPEAYAAAKILNYSINYGKTGAGLGVQIRDEAGDPIGTKEGQALLSLFYQSHPAIARAHKDILVYAQTNGYVRSLLGRFRYIDDWPRWFRATKWKPGDKIPPGGRKAINVIQNAAADIVTMAMLRCAQNPELKRMGCRLVLQVHDELVFEVPTQVATEARAICALEMRNCLERVREFCCPLDVEGGIGENWKLAGGK